MNPLRYSKQELLKWREADDEEGRWHSIASSVPKELLGQTTPSDGPGRRRRKKRSEKQHALEAGDELANPIALPLVLEPTGSMDVEMLSCRESVDHMDNEGDAYDESDDDEFSLQPLAFEVDGEPDFTSGSPQDGFEYLRRVMWEAAQCPKVKVAKIGKKQLTAEQTRYMPVIAPIPTCSSHLLPSKEWVHAFLEDFSALRLSISKIPTNNNCTEDLPSVRNESVWQHLCFGQGKNTFCDGSSDEQNDITADDACAQKLCSPCGNVNSPCLKFLLRLDENSRATLLRYHVEWLKEQSRLGHHRAMWLFALAAAVDYPLDDQTCAAFRDLLRKCAEFRAVKSEVDEELYMINILITIAGEFFGQAEQFSTLNA